MMITLNVFGQEYYFINAENGLNVRSNGNLSSKKIAKIPFGVLVEKIGETDKTVSINDNGKLVKGRFVKIKYNNYLYLVSAETDPFEREGYVFDAYLKAIINKNAVSITKIDKTNYHNLLKKANKKVHNPKKIENLNTIKTILKKRVEWVTVFKNEEYQRDDILKSITTQNGQKLLSNLISNDYGFSEGYSGYYPDYDILVLEGGHASDVCFSITTGETTSTIGNPKYIIPSPKNNYRLNGSYGGQECISYFFQKKENGKYYYLTSFNGNDDLCTFKAFYWMTETEFIYTKMNYATNSENGIEEYYKGKINQ